MPVERLLLIGDDFRMPHGVVNYTLPLARGLRQAGLEVHYFYSGSYFHAYDLRILPRLDRFQQDGIFFYRIVNSPIYAQVPGSPEADLASPPIERMLATVLDKVRPDIAYVDSLLGLPSRCLAVIAVRGVPIVLTHHVYRFFCQHGVFFDRDRLFCNGPGDPERCARCYRQDDAKKYILTAQLRSSPLLSRFLDRVGFPVVRAVRGRLGLRTGPGRQEEEPTEALPDGDLRSPGNEGRCRPIGSAAEDPTDRLPLGNVISPKNEDRRAPENTSIGARTGRQARPAGTGSPLQEQAGIAGQTVRTSETSQGPGTPGLSERLQARFRRNVDLLNRQVAVNICVSEDVRRNLVRFGVRPETLLVQHIGSAATERFRPRKHPLDPDQVVIGNIGGLGPYKGSHVLVQALGLLRDRKNWTAFLFGKSNEGYRQELEGIFLDPRIRYTGPYRFEEIDSLVDRIDLTVLPSVCNDTAPQTIFESFAGRVPIVASHIGGFPDFIRPGENGFLFEPGNSADLAEKLDIILREPRIIEEMSARITRPKTLTENIGELLDLFERLHSHRPGDHKP